VISMTTTRRHPGETPRLHGEIPRRHRGACVVAPKAGSIPARWPSSGETGARFESACLCAVETISGANSGETKARVVPAIRGTLFNADRLTDSGLKPEMDLACHTPHKGPRGLAHSAGQGSTAQPGGRRPYPSRSLAGHRFADTGFERDSSHVPRCDGAFAGLDPHSLRWHESELERRNRELMEENDALRRTLMRGSR